MASLNLAKLTLSPFSTSRSNFPGKPSDYNRISVRNKPHFLFYRPRKLKLPLCSLQDGDNQSNVEAGGEEPPESLFMKELKRRGMTPTSLIGDTKWKGLEEIKLGEGGEEAEEGNRGGFSRRNAVSSAELDKSLSNQRERSMALNSEGLEGLVPRAKLLLTFGGTFFLGFGPLILITVAFFSALYLYYGSTFVHDASQRSVPPPPYVDPYALLEDQRISQTAPSLR